MSSWEAHLSGIAHRFSFGLIALILASAVPARGELRFDDTWRWTTFTTETGLPSDDVIDLIETPDGTAWVATRAGVAWFDHFRWHAVQEGLEHGIPTLIIAAGDDDIALIVNGHLYRGGRRGFARLDVQWDKKVLIVEGVVSPEKNRLWVLARPFGNTELSLYEWSPEGLSTIEMPARAGSFPFRRLWQTASGRIWLSTAQGLYRRTNSMWENAQPIDNSWFGIRCLAENRVGRGAVQVSNPRNLMALYTWEPDGILRQDSMSSGQQLILMDMNEAGDLLGIRESGELVLREQGEWHTVWAVRIRTPLVSVLRFSSSGDLWVGTQDGLMLFRASASRWTRWARSNDRFGQNVHDIIQAKDGTYWLATREGLEHRTEDGQVLERFAEALGTSLEGCTAVGEDEQRRIWVGSGMSFPGCFRYSGHEWTRIAEDSGLAGAYIHRICKDRHNRLWFAALGPALPHTTAEGPGAFLMTQDRFERWGTERGLPSGRVYAVMEGVDGSLWFGTIWGLSRYHGGDWTHWMAGKGLRSGRVFRVVQTPDGRVWFGQQGDGIGYIDSNDVAHPVEDEALRSHGVIWDLKVDDHGVLWASSYSGLCCYREGEWFDLSAKTGLGSCLIWPVLPLSDRVLVGTLGRGVSVLRPDEADRIAPRVEIKDRVVESSTAWMRWSVFPFDGATPANLIETRYRVDNQPWSNWSRAREVEYDLLPHGSHRFAVQARGLLGDVTDPGYGVSFTLPPPIYLRPKVMLPVVLLGLTALGLAYMLYSRRHRHAQAILESEKQLQSILDHTPAVVYIKAIDGKYIFVNKRYEALFHNTRTEVVGKTDYEIFPKDVADEFRRNDKRVTRNRSAELIEEQAPHDDGLHTYISAKFPLLDARGEAVALCGISTDITSRKIAEGLLAERAGHAALSAKVATAFSAEGALSSILTRSASALLEHLSASEVRIWTVDGEKGVQLQTHVHEKGRQVSRSESQSLDSEMQRVVAAPDCAKSPLLEPTEGGGVQVRHGLVVQDRVVGIMTIEFAKAPNETTAAVIKSVADTMAIGIERFRVTEALLHEQTLQKALLASISEGIAACDADGNLTVFNKALYEMHGCEPSDFSGNWEMPLQILDSRTGRKLQRDEFPLMQALRGQQIHNEELTIRRANGTELVCLSSGRAIITTDGRRLGAVVAVRDVSERKRSENALRHSEERLRATLGQAAVGISETDPSGRYLLVNQRFCDIVGFTREELLQRRFQDITHPDDVQGDVEQFRRLLSGEIDRYLIEKRYFRKDGSWVWVNLTVSAVRQSAENQGYVIAVIEDITQRRRAAEALRRQALVFENIMDGVLILNEKGIISDCNPAAELIFGYTHNELVGQSPEMLNRPTEGPAITRSIREGIYKTGRWEGEITFVRRDGTEGFCEAIIVPLFDEGRRQVGTVAVNRDITARKEAEEEKAQLQRQLYQTQMMEAVGTLASGIAHDFRNLLEAISTLIQLARGTLPSNHPGSVSLDKVTQAAKQARGVVQALLTYSHQGPLNKTRLNMKALICEAMAMARSLPFSPTIELSADTDAGENAWILGDETLLQQVIINLALNAADAMPRGGQFRVALERDPSQPDQIQIRVEDTGVGMAPDVLERIFEPYFTTKPRGHAAGLGMALIHNVITRHGGTIDVDSRPGDGTRVCISLPCVPGEPSEPAALEQISEPAQILLVGTTDQVRSIITSALRGSGHQVQAGRRVSEASQYLSALGTGVGLVIIGSPAASTRGVAQLLDRLDSQGIRRLMLLEEGVEPPDSRAPQGVTYLRKPFQIPELLEAVAFALAAPVTEVPS